MSCSNAAGDLAPFCEPANNTEVNPGNKVTVTWDSSYFGDKSTLVQIQADFNPSSGDDPTPLDDAGFTSNSLRAGTGSYSWAISDSILNSSSSDAGGIDAQLYIVVASGDGGTENRTLGPLVRVIPVGSSDDGSSTGGPNLVAIILPVVVGVLLLMAVVAFLLVKRRNPGWQLKSLFGMGKSDGYGSRKAKGERTAGPSEPGAVTGSGVQMGDMGISGPSNGRNVFRDELKRQEEARI